MLRQMAREGQQPVDQFLQLHDQRIAHVQPRIAEAPFLHAAGMAAPHGAADPRGDIFRQAQHLADFPHRAARAVMDDGRGYGGAIATIAGVNMLDHLLTPFMLEIDVDIGWFVAILRNETGKEQVMPGRIDRGDPQIIANRRIGRRSASLAQDRWIEAAGKLHRFIDGQKIAGVIAAADQRELFRQHRMDPIRHAIGKGLSRQPQHFMFQPVLRRPPFGHRLMRIFIFQMRQIEPDPVQHVAPCPHRLRPVAEQARHFACGFQVPFGIRLQPPPGLPQGHALPDTGDDIVQRPVLRHGIERIAGRKQRQPQPPGHRRQPGKAAAVRPGARHGDADPQRTRHPLRQPCQQRLVRFPCHSNQDHVLRMVDQVGQAQVAIALLHRLFQIADAQQPGQPPPAMAVDGVGDNVRRPVGKAEPRAGDETESLRQRQRLRRKMTALRSRLWGFARADSLILGILGQHPAHRFECAPRPHHPGHRIAIGNADARMAQRQRLSDHIGRMRRAAQETIIGCRDHFGKIRRRRWRSRSPRPQRRVERDGLTPLPLRPRITPPAHANRPCRYQRGIGLSGSKKPRRNIQKRRPRRSSTR